MTQLLKENFQSATSVPADLFVAGTAPTFVTNVSPQLYGPNALSVAGGVSTAVFSTVTDGSSGNCTVSASFMLTGTITGGNIKPFGVTIQVGTQQFFAQGSEVGYFFLASTQVSPYTALKLYKRTGGVTTTLATVTAISASPFATGIWYTLTMTRNNATLWCVCKREDNGQYLNTSGTWQADYIEGIISTDASPLSLAVSYGGANAQPESGTTTYVGRVVFRDLINTIPVGPLKGVCIQQDYPAGYAHDEFYWNAFPLRKADKSGFYDQMDLAKSIGCNFFRLQYGLRGFYQGYYNLSTLLSRLQTLYSYAQSINLYVYYDEYHDAPGLSTDDWATVSAAMIPARVSIAQTIASFPNALGMDIFNETTYVSSNPITVYNQTTSSQQTIVPTTAQLLSLLGRMLIAIRESCPNLPLTASVAPGTWSATELTTYSYLFDFIDNHTYFDSTTDGSATYGYIGTYGKKVISGEFGGEGNAANGLTWITDLWTNAIHNISYSPQPGVIGMCYYPNYPAHASGDTAMFAWSASPPYATINSTFGPTFQGITVPTYSFRAITTRLRDVLGGHLSQTASNELANALITLNVTLSSSTINELKRGLPNYVVNTIVSIISGSATRSFVVSRGEDAKVIKALAIWLNEYDKANEFFSMIGTLA